MKKPPPLSFPIPKNSIPTKPPPSPPGRKTKTGGNINWGGGETLKSPSLKFFFCLEGGKTKKGRARRELLRTSCLLFPLSYKRYREEGLTREERGGGVGNGSGRDGNGRVVEFFLSPGLGFLGCFYIRLINHKIFGLIPLINNGNIWAPPSLPPCVCEQAPLKTRILLHCAVGNTESPSFVFCWKLAICTPLSREKGGGRGGLKEYRDRKGNHLHFLVN